MPRGTRMTVDSMTTKVRECIAPKFPFVSVDKDADAEVSLGINNGVLWITFAGSDTAKDWIHNFMFWKRPYKRMPVVWLAHAGFVKLWKLCEPVVEKYLVEHKGEYDWINIRGYSHGAALATLCHEFVMFHIQAGDILGNVLVDTFTVAGPRVFSLFGYKYPAERCKNIVRVVYGNDCVPRLPFACMLYKHVGDVIEVDRVCNPFHPSFIYDHSHTNYLRLLENDKGDNWLVVPAQKAYDIVYTVLGAIVAAAMLILLT
jgi:hypothetical protein